VKELHNIDSPNPHWINKLRNGSPVAFHAGMQYLCGILILLGSPLAVADSREAAPAKWVEAIELTGADRYHLSKELIEDLQRQVGERLDPAALDELAGRVRNELQARAVSSRVTPSDRAEHVRVVLEVSMTEGPAAAVPAPEVEWQEEPELNVNSRYTIEDIEITGPGAVKLHRELREEIRRLVGEKFNQDALDRLVERIRIKLGRRAVIRKMIRGDKPEHVKIVLQIGRRREEADLAFSKALYHSKQGWSLKAIGNFKIEDANSILFGLVSDGDDLLERYAGITAGFESRKLVTDHLRFRFLFETYHHKWNGATLRALDDRPDLPGIYRWRKSFQPTLTLVPVRSLTLSAGASFQYFQTQFPFARTESANAAVGDVRFRRQFHDSEDNRHLVEAGYSLRAATRAFQSDFVYARHKVDFGYRISSRRQSVLVHAMAGMVTGRAPLYDRFLLGNSYTLRGWHKYDVAPLGGGRMAHNTLEYRAGKLQVFYDAGAVWDPGERVVARHAAGLGFFDDSGPERLVMAGFFASLAFPLRAGRMEPIFMIGVNF